MLADNAGDKREHSELKVYKAMERRWAAHFINSGEVLIGTLHDYRKEEVHGHNNDKVDTAEGKVLWAHSVEGETLLSDIPKSSPAHQIIGGHGGATFAFQDCVFEQDIQMPNCYIYSMSEEADPAVAHKLDEEYNCFVEILDVFKFYQILSAYIHKKKIGAPFALNRCEYSEKVIQYPDIPTEKIAFTKEVRFAPQKEIRAIWSPLNPSPIEPIKIRCHAIKRLVKLHSTF